MRHSRERQRLKQVAALSCCLFLAACSSHAPAPVSSLNKDYSSVKRGSYLGSYYEVQKGDTLYFISYITGQDINELVALNNLSDAQTIYPGQKLRLWRPNYVAPKYGKKSVAAPVVVAAAATAATITPKPVPTIKNTKKQTKTTASVKKTQAKPKAATQKTATKPATTKKNVDQGRTKGYSQTVSVNKNTTNGAKNTNKKVASWAWPTKGRVVAKFSNRENGNKGIDIAGKRGQAVTATASGTVVYAGSALRGYGNLVIIKHNSDYLSAYAHNDKILVKEKQKVKAGQKIAAMGSTDARDVRLHFEIRYKGKSVDPMRYLPR